MSTSKAATLERFRRDRWLLILYSEVMMQFDIYGDVGKVAETIVGEKILYLPHFCAEA